MTLKYSNPFRVVPTESGDSIQAGLLPDAKLLKLEEGDLRTLVLVGELGEAGGPPILELPGLWAPSPRALIQVGDPNRQLVVFDVTYRFDSKGLWSFVSVQDSMERVYDPEGEGS